MLKTLYYLCEVFGLASYRYVADRRNKRVTTDYGNLNCMFTVLWLNLYTAALPVEIMMIKSFDLFTQTLVTAYILFIISSYTSSVMTVVWVSIVKRKCF